MPSRSHVRPALVAAVLLAAAPVHAFKMRGKMHQMVEVTRFRIYLDRSCVTAGAPGKCAAGDALRTATLEKNPKTFGEIDGPCVHAAGTVVIGTDSIGSENQFCLFADGSAVDARGLHAMALANDQARSRR